MKKIAALILTALLAFSFTACGSQQNTGSTKTTSAVTQNDTQNNSSATKNSTIANATTSNSKSTSVNPNAKFTGKPVQKQQMSNATNDIKSTMSQIQSTLNSLDSAADVNTDNVQ